MDRLENKEIHISKKALEWNILTDRERQWKVDNDMEAQMDRELRMVEEMWAGVTMMDI